MYLPTYLPTYLHGVRRWCRDWIPEAGITHLTDRYRAFPRLVYTTDYHTFLITHSLSIQATHPQILLCIPLLPLFKVRIKITKNASLVQRSFLF